MAAKRKSLRSKPQQRVSATEALSFAEKKAEKESKSGQIPDGDVRLTANMREDLHMKLKLAAVQRRTTIGELLEQLVEENL